MGSKSGYADRILTLLGLVPGQGAGHYLWCEPDAGCRLLLEAYRDAGLARAAADIIRGWAGEDPRALWERLRAEGPPRYPAEAREVARVAFVQRLAGMSLPWGSYCDIMGHGGCDPRTGQRYPFNLHKNPIRLDRTPTLPATIAPDARAVDPREVARWAWVQGHGIPDGRLAAPYLNPDGNKDGSWKAPPRDWLAGRFGALDTLPATIAPDANWVDPGAVLPAGTVVYVDPPYVGTTGYAADLDRAEVVGLARRWAGAGALVAISEAEPISDLVAEGWHAVEVTDCRRGQARTFSRQQSEWVTLNRVPVDAVGPVFDLFG